MPELLSSIAADLSTKINTFLTALSNGSLTGTAQATVGKLQPIKIKIFKQSVKMQSPAVKKDTWPENGRGLEKVVAPPAAAAAAPGGCLGLLPL